MAEYIPDLPPTEAEQHQKASEEAGRAHLAKSDFLSQMSHELRTPLNAIIGFGQLLEHSDLSAGDAQSVEYILKGGRHLLSLVDDVLVLARVEAGDMPLVLASVTFHSVTKECIGLTDPAAQARGISCVAEVSPAFHLPVQADAQRLRQIVLNLLSNAIKYNRECGAVSVDCQQRPNGAVRLSVSDTGPGLSASDLTRLFVPFERLGQEFGKVQGTGLGLFVSRRMAEAMGGHLGVTSHVGVGSTFWIELPSDPSLDLADMADSLRTLSEPAVDLSTASLLYNEDNASNTQVVQTPVNRLRPNAGFLSDHLAH